MKKRIIAILLCLTILLIILVLILSGAIKSSDENTYLTLVNKTHAFPDDWVSDPELGEEYCKKYLAVPGFSEHHTGFAVDIFIMKDGKEIRDKHLRYLNSTKIAREITSKGLAFEEYLETK